MWELIYREIHMNRNQFMLVLGAIGSLSLLAISINTLSGNAIPVSNITDWKGCYEDEVTVIITQDPMSDKLSNEHYCVARDDLRVK